MAVACLHWGEFWNPAQGGKHEGRKDQQHTARLLAPQGSSDFSLCNPILSARSIITHHACMHACMVVEMHVHALIHFVHIYICKYMLPCMHTCIQACAYVRMLACMYECTYACTMARSCIFVRGRMYVCT